MNAVDVIRLSRRYGRGDSGNALSDLSLTIPVGEVHGLLGPNGAGKTTLCRILSTVLAPTSGTATVLGSDVVTQAAAVKRKLAVVFGGDRGLYGRLTARQNLSFWAALYGLSGRRARERVDAVLSVVGLDERAAERVDTFSRGMKQRLHLARGLVAEPPVLILDEPTAGLDPVATREFRELVRALRRGGSTILLATHDMAEATALCDRVTLLDRGEVLATEHPDDLGRLVTGHERVEADGVPPDVLADLCELPGVRAADPADDGWLRLECATTAATSAVLDVLVRAGVTRLRTGRPTLDEVYLRTYGGRGLAVRA
ncbi:ABC transporter ATP-binding protein [Actinophytocola oryzae]|uniref:ABC-2 type transport system ATP-binding protein n=1 Tax=Actinophytocola oryzae TaxID=502181 RepID=A0A4R7VH85_9PSEU|nr:ABC transporter ATP-binding protein [Actinophytocola oryzae]TDV48690.1 ABC-2 type transport system ATP-binding protein [Actinophytocola oryzae]